MYKFLISIGVVILLFISACGTNSGSQNRASTTPDAFRSQLSGAVKVYFELKDALVVADSKLALEKAAKLKTTLVNIDASDLSGELLSRWKQTVKDLQEKIAAEVVSKDIEAQRAAFLPVSETMIECVKSFGPLEMPLYVKHCPMAFDNSGADWLSDKKEVNNPYFGKGMMHNCGTVKETIAAK
ncbi:MAG: DUF3347 domain-containing protein [Calditrichia bacterium]